MAVSLVGQLGSLLVRERSDGRVVKPYPPALLIVDCVTLGSSLDPSELPFLHKSKADNPSFDSTEPFRGYG